jgi:hypothetical protein
VAPPPARRSGGLIILPQLTLDTLELVLLELVLLELVLLELVLLELVLTRLSLEGKLPSSQLTGSKQDLVLSKIWF